MNAKRHLILGVFFAAVILVLGYYTLFLTDFQLFGEKARLTVFFSETNGLRRGDTVLVAGMRWGKVETLVFDPAAPQQDRITVSVSLHEPIDLHEDFAIKVEDATLLGGKNLTIEPGTASLAVIADDTRLYGTVSNNVIKALGELVEDNREALSNTIASLDAITADVRGGKARPRPAAWW